MVYPRILDLPLSKKKKDSANEDMARFADVTLCTSSEPAATFGTGTVGSKACAGEQVTQDQAQWGKGWEADGGSHSGRGCRRGSPQGWHPFMQEARP